MFRFLNIFLSRVLDESISVQKKVGGLLNAIVNKKIVRDSLVSSDVPQSFDFLFFKICIFSLFLVESSCLIEFVFF